MKKKVEYKEVERCPLCDCESIFRSKLSRSSYFFGNFEIPIPDSGVILRECTNCSLLYKSSVPTKIAISEIMSLAATKVWQSKKGIDSSVEFIQPFIVENGDRIIDIGSSNGDLLVELKKYSRYLSAVDIVVYPKCKDIINGEYIIGDIEEKLEWSGKGYNIATTFDIFEHFINPTKALSNISSLLLKNGKLIIETGDWTFFDNNLGDWYYANLFEHQVFWNNKSITYLCERFGFRLLEYRRVKHKYIRNISFPTKLALSLVVKCSHFNWFRKLMIQLGKGDPSRFIPPKLQDHAFIVLEKL
jgi:SAM-dependent methyltransferase